MRKKSQLENVLDGITGASIFVAAQETHEVLYVNDRLRRFKPGLRLGAFCNEVWKCGFFHCPACSMGDKESVSVINYDASFGKMLDMSATKVMWEDEIPAYVVSVSNHVGEEMGQEQEQELQVALAAAERANRVKLEFISRISHDIRTPLNAIAGMTAIAEGNLENPRKIAGCLEKMRVSTRFLTSMVNDMLDMSRIEDGRLVVVQKEFHFRSLVQGLMAMIAPQIEEKKQNFHLTIDDNVAEIYIGDELRLSQILLNLLNNAVQYTEIGGNISLAAEQIEKQKNQEVLHLQISDNGIGMSEEFQKVLYEPFEQENSTEGRVFEGSGLGLSITQNLVHLMGGTIQFESKKNQGTTFIIELPFTAAKRKEKKESSLDMQEGFQGERILVVEDNDINMEIVQTILEGWNLIVDPAENGLVALEKFRNSQLGWYRLVLMDIRMPVMDGITATKEIRALERADAGTVPIMALTANASQDDSQYAQRIGMNEYLTKPVEMKVLYRKLKEFISA